MHLVQLLLPVYDGDGASLRDEHARVRDELAERFGGVTAFTRAPAEGLWKPAPGAPPDRDSVVVLEVMVERLEHGWWADYRRELERRLRQDEVVIRAQEMERL